MSGTERFDWEVPVEPLARLERLIDRERTLNDRYRRQYIEMVMEEFVGDDPAQPVEQKVRRIARAAGRSVDPQTNRKNISSPSRSGSGSGSDTLASDALANQEKIRVSHRVFEPILNEFIATAKELAPDDDLGVVLGLASREYVEARRIDRIDRMLDQTADDIEKAVDRLADGPDQLKGREKKLVKICQRLDIPDDRNMHRDQITEVITDIAGETVVEWYLPRVLDRLGRVEHPSNPDLYIHESQMDRFGIDPDAPTHDRKPIDALDTDERRNAIAIELARASLSRGGPAAKDAKTIHTEIIDGNYSRAHIRQLMKDLADRDGFRYRTYDDRANKLQVDARGLDTDGPAFAALRYDTDKRREAADDEQADETDGDALANVEGPTMDELMNAETARTDGGISGGGG